MSETIEDLGRRIASAGTLASVARTMKVLSASNIGHYERAVLALKEYSRTVELGLAAYFRMSPRPASAAMPSPARTGVFVFGSDLGLVGQFNERLAAFVASGIEALPGATMLWAVGDRARSALEDRELDLAGWFAAPNSADGITPVMGRILSECESRRASGEIDQVYLFHNAPRRGALYEPVMVRLLPLDEIWMDSVETIDWPTNNLPEVTGEAGTALAALIREYLFVSLYRACAESLAAENASRLAAMQRAEKNIDESLRSLRHAYQRLRQSSIDEELFEVVAGFEALAHDETRRPVQTPNGAAPENGGRGR